MKLDKQNIAPAQSIAEEPVPALVAEVEAAPLTITQTSRHPETGELITGQEGE
jgi:hypothetical protein